MPVIQRTAMSDFQAFQVASAFDKHGIRVVAVVPPPPGREMWTVYGQGEGFDCDAVDETIDRILNGEEQP